MEKAEFIKKIFYTPCEECPIEGYCKLCKSFSCTSTARQYYYHIINFRGCFAWPLKRTEFNLD